MKGRPTKKESCNDFCRVCRCNFKILYVRVFIRRVSTEHLSPYAVEKCRLADLVTELGFCIWVWGMLCQTNHLIYQALSEGYWQNCEAINSCEKPVCKASIVALQGIYLENRDQQSCKTSPMVNSNRTLTSGCQRSGISQSYFSVVRATHNSNPWA